MVRAQPILLYLILFGSGFAGLGYQGVWTRMLALGLGHEIVSVLAVVAAFFCGLSLGGFLLDGPVSRSRRPGAWYAALEAVIGIWGLLLIGLIPAVNHLLPRWLGSEPSPWLHWSLAFFVPLVALLPATVAMGGTLASAERVAARLQGTSRALGGVYAANTLGAMAGALFTTFFLAPRFGFAVTLLVLAGINVACALAIFLGLAKRELGQEEPSVVAVPEAGGGPWMALLFATGLLGVGYEVVAIRAMSQVLENTIYSYTSLLAVYLFGTAAGAAAYQRLSPGDGVRPVLARLLQAQATTGVIGTLALWWIADVYRATQGGVGHGWWGSVAAELAAGAVVFLLPTMVMGAVFTHLSQALRRADGGIGAAAGINTLGAAAAPFLWGVFLLPRLGIVWALLSISLGYLALVPWGGWRRFTPALIPVGTALTLGLGPWPLDLLELPPGGRVVESKEGVMATVSVVNDAAGGAHLKINNNFDMGGTASLRLDRRQAHLPLLLHEAPRHALFLGLGTGATFAGAAFHPELEATGVELVPEVRHLLHHFQAVSGEIESSDRLRVQYADARRFVASSAASYDVIVADLFHPARDGAGTLYTQEHFQMVADKLVEGGVFCQWLPLFQLDLNTLRLVVRTFLSVFPDSTAYVADFSVETPIIGLVTGTRPAALTLEALIGRAAEPGLAKALTKVGLNGPVQLLGLEVAAAEGLKAFAGSGPINTDDRPLVIYTAPRAVYQPLPPAGKRLLAFLDGVHADAETSTSPSLASFEGRVAAYRQARDAFLRLGTQVDPRSGADEMARRLPGPLLRIVRMSPDFRPAYDPLLAIGRHLYARGEQSTARALLTALEAANPARHEARRLRQELFQEG